MIDPRDAAQILGGSLITAAVIYVVAQQVLEANNVTGGLWSIGLFLLSVVPVAGAIVYLFK